MFLEWTLLSQTQTCQNHDILENMRKENIVPRLNTQICNTINTLDSRNWCNFSSANAASHVFIHEAPEFQNDIKCESSCINKKKSIFDEMFDFLEELVSELNGIIAYVLGDY